MPPVPQFIDELHRWDYILERISALKHSLKSKLTSAKVIRNGDSFVIYLNDVFYKILSANTNDIELMKKRRKAEIVYLLN